MGLFDFLRRPRQRIEDAVWRPVLRAIPILAGLGPEEEARLRGLAEDLLNDKTIELVQGAEVDDHLLVGLAAQACLPIMNLGPGGYRDWRTLILYPAEFVAPRHQVDEAGVHHRWEEELSGEAWDDGPVVLSLADVGASGLADGYNVIVHEMVHKLDLLDGYANGQPPLHAGMDGDVWFRAFDTEYRRMLGEVERGRPTALDPYAVTDPAEFLAVTSEVFFEQPQLLRDEMPAVYEQLAAFFRQDPLTRLASRADAD